MAEAEARAAAAVGELAVLDEEAHAAAAAAERAGKLSRHLQEG